LAGDARGRGDCEHQAGALLAHHRQDGASDIHRAEQQRLELIADLFRAELLEEAGEEIPRVVDQDVDPAELSDGGLDCSLGVLRAGDVELDCQQAVVVADRRRDLRAIAAGGHDRMPGGQDGLGGVDAQAPACAGDQPHFFLSHGMFLTWTTSDHKTNRPYFTRSPKRLTARYLSGVMNFDVGN
jgi:hypothetical protein